MNQKIPKIVGIILSVCLIAALFVTAATATDTGETDTSATPTATATTSPTPAPTPTPTPTPTKHSITITANLEHGRISCNKTEAAKDETVYFTVTPDAGYKISSVYFNSTSLTKVSGDDKTSAGYSFTMPDADVVLNATFEETKYTVTVNAQGNGIATLSTSSTGSTTGDYDYWDLVTVYIRPASDSFVESVVVNGSSVEISSSTYSYTYTFRVEKDTTITVNFTNELKAEVDFNGSGYYGSAEVYDWYEQNTYYIPGETVYIECEPRDGYNVKKVTVTDTVTGNTLSVSQSSTDKNIYYFTMPEHPVKVYVEFQEGYAIKVADTKYGKVKVSAENADEDDVITITTEPDKGYAVSKISIKTDGGETVTYRTSIATKNSYYFYMPDDNVTITVTFGVAHKDMPFTDVYSYSWFYDAVQFVYDNDIMNGVSDTSFNPDGTVTRGMIVTMLWRMAGEPYSFGGGFSDVPAGHYCYSAAAWASRNGIVNGMTSTTFAPDTNITREQLVTILYRYAQYLGYSTTGSSLYGFTDASSVSSYAANAMSWAVKHGIISGVTTSTLVPAGTATRAQAAQMFMSFYDFLG